jgi:hypothetical protein
MVTWSKKWPLNKVKKKNVFELLNSCQQLFKNCSGYKIVSINSYFIQLLLEYLNSIR